MRDGWLYDEVDTDSDAEKIPLKIPKLYSQWKTNVYFKAFELPLATLNHNAAYSAEYTCLFNTHVINFYKILICLYCC